MHARFCYWHCTHIGEKSLTQEVLVYLGVYESRPAKTNGDHGDEDVDQEISAFV